MFNFVVSSSCLEAGRGAAARSVAPSAPGGRLTYRDGRTEHESAS
eukprot:SAG31_NODE_3895_length_3773_cov_21.681818_2_plen_45_part_00